MQRLSIVLDNKLPGIRNSLFAPSLYQVAWKHLLYKQQCLNSVIIQIIINVSITDKDPFYSWNTYFTVFLIWNTWCLMFSSAGIFSRRWGQINSQEKTTEISEKVVVARRRVMLCCLFHSLMNQINHKPYRTWRVAIWSAGGRCHLNPCCHPREQALESWPS